MNVGDDGQRALLADRLKPVEAARVGNRDADDLAARVRERANLCEGRGGVVGLGRAHRLDRYGRTAAHRNAADMHLVRELSANPSFAFSHPYSHQKNRVLRSFLSAKQNTSRKKASPR